MTRPFHEIESPFEPGRFTDSRDANASWLLQSAKEIVYRKKVLRHQRRSSAGASHRPLPAGKSEPYKSTLPALWLDLT